MASNGIFDQILYPYIQQNEVTKCTNILLKLLGHYSHSSYLPRYFFGRCVPYSMLSH